MGYSLFIKKIMSSFQLSSWFLLPLAAGLALLTSACGVPVAVSAASYAADGGLLATSNKTSTDHIASVVTKKDCAIWRVFRGRQMCTQRADGEDPYDTDYTEPQRSVSEGGVSYSSPLRPSSDSPAVSWDSTAYDTPAPPAAAPAARQAPMTATVEPVPERSAPAAAVSPAPAKSKKAKTVQRSAKRPSRGPAASAP
jgi:hypothetical protein